MATIAGPRPTHPRHVGTLLDVTSSRTNTPLRRSQHKINSQASPSLRLSYLAASALEVQKAQALKSQLQHAALVQVHNHSLTSPNTMDNTHGYEKLSSGRSYSSSNYSIASNGAVAGQQLALTETRSSPVSLYSYCTCNSLYSFVADHTMEGSVWQSSPKQACLAC